MGAVPVPTVPSGVGAILLAYGGTEAAAMGAELANRSALAVAEIVAVGVGGLITDSVARARVGAQRVAELRPGADVGGSTGADEFGLIGYQKRAEMLMRAQYALAAFRRVIRAPDKVAQLRKERSYFGGHLRASTNRMTAAELVHETARRLGPILGWISVRIPGVTTPECWDAHGRNFDVRRPPPRIGLPGAVHPECKCRAGRPFEGAPMLT
jgi:hypothetical protein